MAKAKVSSDNCVSVLKALGDDNRWRMVQVLLQESLSVSDLGGRVDVPQYNVSKHIAVLRDAGIVVTARAGKAVMCSIAPEFRAELTRNKNRLDFGCCAFDFNRSRR